MHAPVLFRYSKDLNLLISLFYPIHKYTKSHFITDKNMKFILTVKDVHFDIISNYCNFLHMKKARGVRLNTYSSRSKLESTIAIYFIDYIIYKMHKTSKFVKL